MPSVMSKSNSPSLSNTALSRMLMNGFFLSINPCAGTIAPARAETAILESFGQHEVKSIKLYVRDHDGTPGGVEKERRKRLTQGTQIE